MTARLKSLFGAQDMTVGNPLAVMLKYSIPLLIGNIAQLLYNTVNAVIVGNLIGRNALAAVGASTPVMNLFFTFYMTVGTGISIVVAQYYGAKDMERLSSSIGTSIILAFISTFSITLIGIPASGALLRAISVDESIFAWSHTYLMIMFGGAVGLGFYNVLSGIIRGLGDSVFPLIVLVITSLLNIVLVYFFVGVLGFGVAGAATATVTAQTVSAVICLIKILRMRGIITLNRGMLRPRAEMIKNILRIGLPSGIQQVILNTSETFIMSLINSVAVLDSTGNASYTIFIAAATTFTQLNAMAQLPSQAFSFGASTFAGQNIGAGNEDRVKRGFLYICMTSFAVSLIIFTVVYIWGGSVIRMFIDMGDPEAEKIIYWGVRIQRIMVWCFICNALIQAPSGILRGLGNTMPVMWITFICTVILRMPMAYLWVRFGGSAASDGGNFSGIYWSMVICTFIAGAMSMSYYLSGRWKRRLVVRLDAK